MERIQASLRELQRRQQELKRGREVRVSTSEPEVRRMRMADGLYAPAWNLQLATETAGNVVVGVEVTNQGSDAEQLPGMVEQIRRRLGRVPERMLADGGYTSRRNVEYAHWEGIELYAPWEPDAERHRGGLVRNGIAEEFGPQAFVYDAENDVLICPAGSGWSGGGRGGRTGRGRCVTRLRPRSVRHVRTGASAAGEPRDGADGWSGPRKAKRCGPTWSGWPARKAGSFTASGAGTESFRSCRSRGAGSAALSCEGWRKVRQEGMLWALAYNVMQWIRLVWRKLESAPPTLAAATC